MHTWICSCCGLSISFAHAGGILVTQFSTMDQGWRRFHLLIVFLTFFGHAIGYPTIDSKHVYRRSLPSQKSFSPQGVKSLITDASVSGSWSSQFGGASSSYESMSHAQSSPSGSVSASWPSPQKSESISTQLHFPGPSESNAQGTASQSAGGQGSYSQYDFTYKDRTGLQAGGSVQGGSSFTGAIPESFSELNLAPFDVFEQSHRDEKSFNTASSQGSSGLQLGATSNQLYSQGSGASSQHLSGSPAKLSFSSARLSSPVSSSQGSTSQFTSVFRDSSRSKLQGNSGLFVSAQGGSASLSGLSPQSQSTSSQYVPVSSGSASLGSLPLALSSPPTSEKASPISSPGTQGSLSHTTTYRLSDLKQGLSNRPVGSFVQSQSSPTQQALNSLKYASSYMPTAQTTSGQYNPASAQSLSQGKIPHKWQPSVLSFSQGSQTSSAAFSHSRVSAPISPAPSKSLSFVGHPSQSAPGSQHSSASMASPLSTSSHYSQATDVAPSLSQSQFSHAWKPSSASFSPVGQSSSVAFSQSMFSAPSAPAPSKSLSFVGHPSQSAPGSPHSSASMASPPSTSSHYSQATDVAPSLSQSQFSHAWKPSSASSSPVGQSSSVAFSQSMFSAPSAPAPSKSLSFVGHPSQSAPGSPHSSASMASPPSTSSHYSQATDVAPSLSQSQFSHAWKPSSASSSPVGQSSSVAFSQSMFSAPSAPAPSKSLSFVGHPSQSASGSLYSGAPGGFSQYNEPTDGLLPLSQSKIPQKWQPSVLSLSQGSQTSSAAVSQSKFSAPSESLSHVGHPSLSAPSLYSSASKASPQSSSSQYSQATDGVLPLSQSQFTQTWKPSTASYSQGSQSSVSQSVFSAPSTQVASKSVSFGHPSQSASASRYSGISMPTPLRGSSQYGKATDGAPPLSQSKFTQTWNPSPASYSPGSQASVSQSVFSAPSAQNPSKSLLFNHPSQSASASLYSGASRPAPLRGSSQYGKATDGAPPLSQTQFTQTWKPSPASFSPGSPTSVSQNVLSAPSAQVPSKSLSFGHLSQTAAASLYSGVSMPSPPIISSQYSHTTGGVALSQSKAPQKWQPSASPSSQGYHASSKAVTHSGFASEGAKVPSRLLLTSGSGPSHSVSKQEASSYSGFAQSQGSSGQYDPAYSKAVSSLGVSGQFTSGQGLYASGSPGMAGPTLGASNQYASAQREFVSKVASLQPQVPSSKYANAPSQEVKVTVHSQAAPSQSSMSQTWQSSSRRFPSRAAVMQSSTSPQMAEVTSRLSAQRTGSHSGVPQSSSTAGKYNPGSPAYVKFVSLPLGVSSQSVSSQGVSRQFSSHAQSGTVAEPMSVSGYLSAEGGSGSLGSTLLPQGAVNKDVFTPLHPSIPVSSQTSPVLSDLQASGTAVFQAGSLRETMFSGSDGSQMSPGLYVSSGQSTGSMAPSFGSVHGASEGRLPTSLQTQTLSSAAGFGASEGQGMSSGSSVSSGPMSSGYGSSFGMSATASKPSRGSLSKYSGVKG